MDDKTTGQPEPTVYEQLYHKLLAYRFGTISFLELLEAFEEILGINTHADQRDGA